MPEQGRLGDKSQVPADGHGCPGCPHPCVGPAVAGSPDVLVNGKPALRVGDPGVHAACCGPNTWTAQAGAPHVLINDKKAHRRGDVDRHCGGIGKLIEGSSNVVTGNQGGGGTTSASAAHRYERRFVVVDQATGKPLSGVRYKLTIDWVDVVEGRTDAQGRTSPVERDLDATVTIEVFDD